MEFLTKEILLGLTVEEFLLHLFNFIILVVVLRLLLYKPVKKFMDKREKEYKETEQKYQDSLKQIETCKAQSEEIIESAREESVNIAKEAHALSMLQNDEILNEARKTATVITEKAKKEARQVVEMQKNELMYSISDLAMDISKKILDREMESKDNDKFIESIIKDLNEKDA